MCFFFIDTLGVSLYTVIMSLLYCTNIDTILYTMYLQMNKVDNKTVCTSVTSSHCPSTPLCTFVINLVLQVNYYNFFLIVLMASPKTMRSGTPH